MSTNKKPKASFIMAAYDEDISIIKQSINSSLSQSEKNIELIIVLDKPENKNLANFLSAEAKKDNRIKILINDKNMGRAFSRNRAVAESKGEFLAILDADDVADKKRIELQTKFLEANPDVSLVFGQADFIDMNGKKFKQFRPNRKDFENIRKTIFGRNPLVHSTMTVRREVLMSTPYNKDFTRSQDYEFWLRCAAKEYKFSGIEKKLVDYRVPKFDAVTRVKKQKDVFKYGLRALLLHFKEFKTNPFYLKMLIKFIAFRSTTAILPNGLLAAFVNEKD